MDDKEKVEAWAADRRRSDLAPVATLTAVEMQAFGDRIKGIWDIIDFITKFDLDKIRALLAAIQALVAAEDLKARIKAALLVMEIGAQMTATTVDDEFVATLQRFATDEVLDILVRIIQVFGGFQQQGITTAQATVQMSAADRRRSEAMAIPWALLVQVALQLASFLEKFFKNRG
jgi:hypothetical protein